MKKLLLMSVLLFISACTTIQPAPKEEAVPAMQMGNGHVGFKLYKEPCPAEMNANVEATVPPIERPNVQRATGTFEMPDGTLKTYDGCWAFVSAPKYPVPEDAVFIVFSDGDTRLISYKLFKGGTGV